MHRAQHGSTHSQCLVNSHHWFIHDIACVQGHKNRKILIGVSVTFLLLLSLLLLLFLLIRHQHQKKMLQVR